MAQQPPDRRFGNLGLRLKTAAALLPPVFLAVWFGSPWFDICLIAAAGTMAWEWARICSYGTFGLMGWLMEAAIAVVLLSHYLGGISVSPAVMIGASAAIAAAAMFRRPRHPGFFAAGIVLIGLFCIAFLWLRAYPDHGLALVIWLGGAVWLTDTGAYLAGKTVGGPKMAPRISPNKTWAGMAGGALAAVLWSAGWLAWYGGVALLPYALVAAGVAVLAQAGDLSVSVAKRRFGVKDSSNLIPGHGGVLDRLDGMLLTGPAVVLVLLAANKGWV